MNITIVYDSIFGNTGKVAKAIAETLEQTNQVRLVTVQEAKGLDFTGADLLIVGSPTRGFRPTPLMSEFAEGLSRVEGKAAAVFDTRIDLDTVQPAPLRWVVDAGGYAAQRLATALGHHGYVLRGEPGGFFVGGTEGPLKPGEIERAKAWATSLTP